jgi:hypothetical protein
MVLPNAPSVIPANTGIQFDGVTPWIVLKSFTWCPAFAGMTCSCQLNRSDYKKNKECIMTVQNIDQIVENPCEQYRKLIREVFVRILSKPKFPLSAKLFSMACFAYETDLFLYPGSPDFSEDVLAQEVTRVAGHVYETLWLEEFRKNSMNLELPMSMIQLLLFGMVEKCRPDFKEMILETWAEYIPEKHKKSGHKVLNIFDIKYSDSATRVECSAMTGIYKKRSKQLYQVLGTEIENRLENFCVGFVMSSDHNEYGSLFAYVQRLVLDVVLLKYFIVSNPGLKEKIRKLGIEMRSPGNMPDQERKVLRKAVKDIVTRFSENAAQEEKSIIKLSQSLMEQGMQDIAHTALLIHF